MATSDAQNITGIDTLPATRQRILRAIKQAGAVSASLLAEGLELTREACRQQLQLLQRQGYVDSQEKCSGTAGRPTRLFSLSDKGEHLFPKRYDELSLLLLDTVTNELGRPQLERVLGAVTDKQVAQWQEQLKGLSIKDRLDALKDFYFVNDPYTEVIEDDNGLWLVEHNCPFLNLALERPALCSVTVSTLSRLLGVKVRREHRFQNGDGRCAFHVLPDEPITDDFHFAFED